MEEHCKQFLLVHLGTALTKQRLAASSVPLSLMELSVSGKNLSSHDNNYDFFIERLQRSMAFHNRRLYRHIPYDQSLLHCCTLFSVLCLPSPHYNPYLSQIILHIFQRYLPRSSPTPPFSSIFFIYLVYQSSPRAYVPVT